MLESSFSVHKDVSWLIVASNTCEVNFFFHHPSSHQLGSIHRGVSPHHWGVRRKLLLVLFLVLFLPLPLLLWSSPGSKENFQTITSFRLNRGKRNVYTGRDQMRIVVEEFCNFCSRRSLSGTSAPAASKQSSQLWFNPTWNGEGGSSLNTL